MFTHTMLHVVFLIFCGILKKNSLTIFPFLLQGICVIPRSSTYGAKKRRLLSVFMFGTFNLIHSCFVTLIAPLAYLQSLVFFHLRSR